MGYMHAPTYSVKKTIHTTIYTQIAKRAKWQLMGVSD